jgi:hypothetical protein
MERRRMAPQSDWVPGTESGQDGAGLHQRWRRWIVGGTFEAIDGGDSHTAWLVHKRGFSLKADQEWDAPSMTPSLHEE